MKILLVTRGSQGDIYPYLRIAAELKNRGHYVTLSLPRLFEDLAKKHDIRYVLQASDDIHGLLEDTPDTKNLLQWTLRVIESQIKEIIPMLREHDLLIATNTEFAAGTIAEYCEKPLIRTAYGPFIPSRTIPPPVFPMPNPHPILRPALLWGLLNKGLDFMVLKTMNKKRKELGLSPIKSQAHHAASSAQNFLLYSKYLGSVDNNWQYPWQIGGYCFNDLLPYNKDELDRLIAFIKKDERPTVFFSLGSCNVEHHDKFEQTLFNLCTEKNFKLIVACGWWKVGEQLETKDNLILMEHVIPHCLIFPHCDALIHHGGAGTTHSAARSGRPQMIMPLLLDQFYWNNRVFKLGIGPKGLNIKRVNKKRLEEKLLDLLTNPSYKEKAHALGCLLRSEDGLDNLCKFVERYGDSKLNEKTATA